MNKKHNWMTRERWANSRRHLHYDECDDLPFARRISELASTTEIAEIVGELKRNYKEYGRALRAGNIAAGSLLQQKGETNSGWYTNRYRNMTDAEKDLVRACHVPRECRAAINRALKEIGYGTIPANIIDLGPVPLLEDILKRRDANWRAVTEAAAAKKALTPIDDEAWEAELERRRRLEAQGF
jgi:hypothetical protein